MSTLEEGDKRSCILFVVYPQYSILGIESAFFTVESSLEYINADDVITFCLYLMNKIRLNLLKGLKTAHDRILEPVYIEVEDPRYVR